MGTGKQDIKLEILEAKLFIQKHTLLPSIQMAHLKTWRDDHPIVYPMKQVEIKNYSLPIGTLHNTNENIISGLIRNYCLMGLTLASAMSESFFQRTPLNFEDFGLTSITCAINGEQMTSQTIELDVAEKKIAQAYVALYQGLGLSCDGGLDLRMNEFTQGKTIFVFNLKKFRDEFVLPTHGNVVITLRFKNPTTSVINCIVYADYPAVLQISRDKQIYFKDFNQE